MNKYNGHRSWNAWNTSLWLNNDYSIELLMREYVRSGYSKNQIICRLKADLLGTRTPDGAIYNLLSIRTFVTEYLESN